VGRIGRRPAIVQRPVRAAFAAAAIFAFAAALEGPPFATAKLAFAAAAGESALATAKFALTFAFAFTLEPFALATAVFFPATAYRLARKKEKDQCSRGERLQKTAVHVTSPVVAMDE
jgi:membrane protein implicated in regulation of membrane protease activity